jgi:hypothetical protein
MTAGFYGTKITSIPVIIAGLARVLQFFLVIDMGLFWAQIFVNQLPIC